MSLLIVFSVLVVGVIVMIPIFKVLAKIAPYSYTNARIRAMLPALISDEEFENFTRREYNDVIYAIERKTYPDLSQYTGADLTFASVDSAVRSTLIDNMLKIRRISPQQTKAFLNSLIASHDIQIIQSIVRSQKAQVNAKHDILHATEIFSKAFITKKEITLEDLREELKGTQYEEVFMKHYDDIKKQKYDAFELELDLLSFKRRLHQAKSDEARGFVKRLIDIRNIGLVLQHQDAVIPGGKIPLDAYPADHALQKLIQAIRDHGYTMETEDPSQVERTMQIHLKKYAKALLARNPLSEASIIGYIILKRINVRNTVILLKMKYHNFDPKRIMEVLAV